MGDSVFVLHTGGTIGMVPITTGHAPVANALGPYLDWIVANIRRLGSARRIRPRFGVDEAGAAPDYDMTPEAILTRLEVLLGQDLDAASVVRLMQQDIAGELSRP